MQHRCPKNEDSSKIYFFEKAKVNFHAFLIVHCTVVNKGMKIGILDFELGAFSETLEHL